jgi:hypothetical protein
MASGCADVGLVMSKDLLAEILKLSSSEKIEIVDAVLDSLLPDDFV